MASRGKSRERERYWREHLEACDRSGLTTKAYAEAHGLSTSMLYSWRRELASRDVLCKRAKVREPSGFARVEVIAPEPRSGEWHILLPNGVQIGFSGSVDEAALTSVLTAASRL
jgi:hypothetical protein